MDTTIPPLPAGFQLDNAAPQGLPPLPQGFQLDAGSAVLKENKTPAMAAPLPVHGVLGQLAQMIGMTGGDVARSFTEPLSTSAGWAKKNLASPSELMQVADETLPLPHFFAGASSRVARPVEIDPAVWESANDGQRALMIQKINQAIAGESYADYQKKKLEYQQGLHNEALMQGGETAVAPLGAGILPVTVPLEGATLDQLYPFRPFKQQYGSDKVANVVQAGMQPVADLMETVGKPSTYLTAVGAAEPTLAKLVMPVLTALFAKPAAESLVNRAQQVYTNPSAESIAGAATGVPIDLLTLLGIAHGTKTAFADKPGVKLNREDINPNITYIDRSQQARGTDIPQTSNLLPAPQAPRSPTPPVQELQSQGGFVVGPRGAAETRPMPTGAAGMYELLKPYITPPERQLAAPRDLPMGDVSLPQNRPPFIAGAKDVTGVEGVATATKETMSLHSGLTLDELKDFTWLRSLSPTQLQSPERARLQDYQNKIALDYKPVLNVDGAAVGGAESHADIVNKAVKAAPDQALKIIQAFQDDKNHMFVGSDGVMKSRSELMNLLGADRPVHSHELQAMQVEALRKQRETPMQLRSGFGGDLSDERVKDVLAASGAMTHQSVKMLLDAKESGVKDVGTQIDAGQMWARVKNKLGKDSAEVKMLEQAGAGEKFKQGVKSSPVEMAKWVSENGPKVKVETYGMEGKVSEVKKEYDKMTHEWYENLTPAMRINLDHSPNELDPKLWDTSHKDSIYTRELATKYLNLREQVTNEPKDNSLKATHYYSSVSALPTNEPMPDWTATKSGKNVQRVDVVVPNKADKTYEQWLGTAKPTAENKAVYEQAVREKDSPLWKPDNLHENLPNTLGWAMIQYKTGPKGEKIAVIPELQARWAQEKRKYWETYKEEKKRLLDDPAQYGHVDKAEAERLADKAAHYEAGKGLQYRPGMDHALADNPYRLILKAAIEQARKEGATHIMVSDAETAMMTEGHDVHSGDPEQTVEIAGQKVTHRQGSDAQKDIKVPQLQGWEIPNTGGAVATGEVRVSAGNMRGNDVRVVGKNKEGYTDTWSIVGDRSKKGQDAWKAKLAELGYKSYEVDRSNWRPDQEPGMRLNYDTILPKIAEELTESKGEKVSLGEHKNALKPREDMRNIHAIMDGHIIRTFSGEDAMGDALAWSNNHPEGSRIKLEPRIEPAPRAPRANLIFRNLDGTPKTDVSGRLYPIDKVSARLETGEPMTQFGKLYSGVPLPDLDTIKDITTKVGALIKGDKVKETLSYMKDATSNLVAKNSNEAASSISGLLERQTKVKDKKDSLPRQALTFAVESQGSVDALLKFKKQITESTKADKKERADALLAINYAINNFDKLKPVADQYSKKMEEEAQWEEKSGRKIERRKGYVMHLAEDTGDATSFTHAREYDTMADRISAGVESKSLDAVELMRSRVARGQQVYVQSKVFMDNARKLKDDKGNPVIGTYKEVSRGEGHAPDYQVPEGYKEVKIGMHEVPVLKDYADTLQALTSPSWFMQSAVGRGLMETRGVGKHLTLGFDTFHMGRLAMFAAASKLGTGHMPVFSPKKGVMLLDNTVEELNAKAKAGQIDAKDLPELVEKKRIIDLGIKTGFNAGRVVDQFNQHWTEKIPVSGQFQHYLFNHFQRGVMADVYTTAFDAYKKQMPGHTDAAVARQLSKDLNDVFGTRGRQGWVKSRTGQDLLSLFFLAPQWTEGRIASDVGAVTGTAKAVGQVLQGKKPALNMQSRVVGTTILAYMLGNQVINMMTTGHSTFDNEDGHKLDAFIPDVMSGSTGYWLNPTSNAEEVFHTLHKSMEKEGGDAWQAWLDFMGGRLSTIARPIGVGVTGKQYGITGPDVPRLDGEKFSIKGPSGAAKFKGMVKAAIPIPIGVPELINEMSGTPNQQDEKQMLSRIGLKVDSATNPPADKKTKSKKYKFYSPKQ